MSTQIIQANPTIIRKKPFTSEVLNVAEFFCDSIQGEGIYTGHSAAFLRLKGCCLNCKWCDTREVWRRGNSYTFHRLFELMESVDLPGKLKNGQHLVITGGSPLLQQFSLIHFLQSFFKKYGFKPFIEIENECVIEPSWILDDIYIDCWNNSPKLSNSGVKEKIRYKPDIIKRISGFKNSWFKFVVSSEEDWKEINMNYIINGLIKKEQVILMPQGETRAEFEENRIQVVEMAIKYNVRYSTREHIVLWDKKTGV